MKANKKVSVQFLDAARGPSSSKAPSPTATSQKSFSNSYLIFQTLAEIGLALAAVGWLIRRSLVQAIHRLGLDRPGWRMLAIAVGFTVLVFIVNSLAGYLTQVIQPDVSYDVQQATQSLTSNIHNPAGALLLGVGAGVGEEILLRGALQPRYGIVLTAILFALLHTQYGFSIVVIGLFATGVLLGLERKYWGTTASIITHAIFDTLTVLVVISSR